METDSNTMLVLAQRNPQWGLSSYGTNTVGMNVLREMEPAVYHAYESGVPVRDLKAITPENKAVRQNVIPIRNESGKTIAVLICELDISKSLWQERKYNELIQEQSVLLHPYSKSETIHNLREIHHMVKNNLQMVASILSLQSRKSANPEVREAFQETIGRVLNIASVHEMLLNTADVESVSLKSLFEKIRSNALSLISGDKLIEISILGDDLYVDAVKGTAIALVTNELVSNSLEHAFVGREKGKVDISIQNGNLYSTVTVEDNGIGFNFYRWDRDSLGLSLVSMTVRDKLDGDLRLNSSSTGTKVMFDFKT